MLAVLFSAVLAAVAGGVNTDYITPPSTFSPDHHYGVKIPVFHFDTAEQPDHRKNKIVDLPTGRVIAIIHADPPGYDRALNHHEALWVGGHPILLCCFGKLGASGVPTH
jgi:hypothetical protein